MFGGLLFPNRVSLLIVQLNGFHDHALVILVSITSLVVYWFWSVFTSQIRDRHLIENQTVEVVWTVLPIVILIFIALPSLRLLYLLDEVGGVDFRVKVVGSQWYWSYEYSEFPDVAFESHILVESLKEPRLLEVDNRLTLPFNRQVRLVVRATDVIHSWTVPVLGVKVDAIPGRLNQTRASIPMAGVFYGQCSEICGANHRFMPVVVERVSLEDFLTMF